MTRISQVIGVETASLNIVVAEVGGRAKAMYWSAFVLSAAAASLVRTVYLRAKEDTLYDKKNGRLPEK